MSCRCSYSRVVPVRGLSSVNATLSVPKNASRASTTAVLWQACADGYSGKFGVVRSGRHARHLHAPVRGSTPRRRHRCRAREERLRQPARSRGQAASPGRRAPPLHPGRGTKAAAQHRRKTPSLRKRGYSRARSWGSLVRAQHRPYFSLQNGCMRCPVCSSRIFQRFAGVSARAAAPGWRSLAPVRAPSW